MPKSKKNQSENLSLEVKTRKIFGKKVKKLRQDGYTPATVYGPDFKSQSIQVNTKDFLKVYRTVRETGIVSLQNDSEEIPTLIKSLQRHPINDLILHIDFRKVDLKQKIATDVPVKIIGQSEAVTQKAGVLLTHAETIAIEALPQDIPSNIEIDISKLKELGQEIKVGDLAKVASYEIKEPQEKVIISVIAHKEESVTPETMAPVTEITTEKEKVEEEAKPEEEKGPVKKEESKQPKPEEKPKEKKQEKKS